MSQTELRETLVAARDHGGHERGTSSARALSHSPANGVDRIGAIVAAASVGVTVDAIESLAWWKNRSCSRNSVTQPHAGRGQSPQTDDGY